MEAPAILFANSSYIHRSSPAPAKKSDDNRTKLHFIVASLAKRKGRNGSGGQHSISNWKLLFVSKTGRHDGAESTT